MYGWKRDSFDRKRAEKVDPMCDGRLDATATGIVSGTKVATAHGWRPVEAIAAGDMVLTFDGGLQPVKAVRRNLLWSASDSRDLDAWPLHVPAGALGNREPMSLLPRQPVLIESDAAEAAFGDPFALIPAAALDGYRNITRTRPDTRIEVVTLEFEGEEIVFGNMGALFHCPTGGDLLDAAFDDGAPAYRVFSLEEADDLVTALELEETGPAAQPHGLRVVA